MPSENTWSGNTGGGGGTGSVVGPVSSTDSAVARFDGTTGQALKNSPVTIDDAGNITTPGTVDGRDVSADGATLDTINANYIPTSQKAAPNGVATLDGSGLIPNSQLPPIAITDTFVVSSQAAQVALTAQVGDVAVRTDLNKSYILRLSPATTFSNWQELLTPTDSVLSVNGMTGAVTIGTDLNTASTVVARNANKGFAASYVDHDPTVGDPAYQEGRVFYDNVAKTLAYFNDDPNVKLNIGQESFLRVTNVTGVTIPNGSAVYINGSSGGIVSVALANANALATSRVVGLVTETLTSGAIGYVTTYGVVNGLDTSTYAAGARLFLSATTAGALTTTAPTGVNYSAPVGYANMINATVGTIFVDGGIKGQIGRGSANQLRGVNAAATEEENKTIQGTTNEVTVTHGVSTITLGTGIAQYTKGGTAATTQLGAAANLGSSIPLVVTAGQAMVAGQEYLANTTSGGFSLSFPTGVTGARIRIRDPKRTWSTNNLTLTTAQSIAGQGTGVPLVCNVQGGWGDFVYDGATWTLMSMASSLFTGGSGSGEKNYIATPNNATGFVASGVGIAVTTESTRSNLPDNSTQQTGVKFLRASGSDYAYARFTLDQVDYNKKLKLVLDMAYAGAAGDYTVTVFSNTLANYTGTSTQLVLANGSLPGAFTGQFGTTFDSSGSTAPYIEVRINGIAGTTALYANNVLVGPGVLGSVPAVGFLGRLASLTTAGLGTTVSVAADTFRTGANFKIQGALTLGTTAATAASFTLPYGLTYLSATNQPMGRWYVDGPTAAQRKGGPLYATGSSGLIQFASDDSVSSASPFAPLNGTGVHPTGAVRLAFEIELPCYSDGGVNMGAGAQVQFFSSSTGAWDAAAAVGNTVAGVSSITSALTANRAKVVRLPFAPQSISDVKLVFLPAGFTAPVGQETWAPYVGTGGFDFGAKVTALSGTDVTITFYQNKVQGTTFNSATGAGGWGTTDGAWGLIVANPSSPVGYGLATATDSGLVSGNGGYPGSLLATAVPANKIGEVISATVTDSAIGTTIASYGQITLTPGTWRITYEAGCEVVTAAAAGSVEYAYCETYDSTAGNTIAGTIRSIFIRNPSGSTGVSNMMGWMSASTTVYLSSSKVYQLRAKRIDSTGVGTASIFNNGLAQSQFFATRIA